MSSLYLLSSMKRVVFIALLLLASLPAAQAQTPAAQTTPPQSPELAEASKLAVQVVELYNQGRYDDALPLAKRALEIREQALGPEHPLVGDAALNLASVQLAKKDYGAAQSLYKRALKIFEKAKGPDDVKVAVALDQVGWLYVAQGDVGHAEATFLRSLAIREKALGPDHDDVAQSTFRLAQLYDQLGRFGKAAEYYKRTVAIREKTLGPHNPQLIDYLQRCACALTANGEAREASEVQDRIYEIRYKKTPQMVMASGEILQGKATYRIQPDYPLDARRRRIYGTVIVEATVDESGHVVDAHATCGPQMLRDVSVEAARKWRFTPTTRNGVPVKVTGYISFNFHL